MTRGVSDQNHWDRGGSSPASSMTSTVNGVTVSALAEVDPAPPRHARTGAVAPDDADSLDAMGVTSPQVSVLMTAYNSAKYLRRALDSLFSQSFQDFEVVVVDDGSTDATGQILADYAERYDAMTVLTNGQCQGISRAANRGLAACRAAVIARMDADDVAYPDRLEKQLAFFRDSGAVAVGCYVEFIDHRGRALTVMPSPLDDTTIQKLLLQGDCTLWHTGSMMSAAALRRVGGYNEAYGSAVDIELWLRLGEVGSLANQPETLQQYRYYGDSVSARRREQQMQLCEQATREAARRRGIEPCFIKKEHWRSGATKASKLRFIHRLGWWAHRSGHLRTTAVYGLKALRLRPWSWQGWMLLKAAAVAGLTGRRAVAPAAYSSSS